VKIKRLLLFNLPNKVAASTLVLICVGFWPLIYFTTTKLEAHLTRLLQSQQVSSVNLVANDLEQKILLRTQALQDVADALPIDKVHDPAAVTAYFEKRLAIYRLFTYGVVLIGADGFGIADYPKVENRSHADYRQFEYFREVLATGKPAIGKPRLGRFTKQPGVGIAIPVKDDKDEIKAVLVGIIGLTDRAVFDQTHARLGKTGEYVLLSARDRLVIIDPASQDGLRELAPVGKDPVMDRFMTGFEGATVMDQFHHVESLAAAKTILDGRWLVVGMLPTEEAFAPIVRLKTEISLAAILILIVILCLMVWLIHYQLRPLTEATRTLTRMVSDGTPLHELPVTSGDEVGQLLRAFNQLQKELQASHQAVFEQKEFLRSVYENEPECVNVISTSGALLDMNPAGLAMFEVKNIEEARRYGLLNFIHPDFRESFAAFNRRICAGETGVLEFLLIGKEGTPLWLETHATPLRDDMGQITGLIGITRDITESRALHQELKYQAQNDYLTGLSNRRRFMELAEQELVRTTRYRKQLSIFMVDIDYFKKVNDTYGHKTGDVVLQQLSETLRSTLREIDVIGRLGGEEFAVLLPETALSEATEVAERLRERVAEQEIVLETGMPLHFTVSIGVACLQQKNSNIDMLLNLADEALYKAKEGGRNRVFVG